MGEPAHGPPQSNHIPAQPGAVGALRRLANPAPPVISASSSPLSLFFLQPGILFLFALLALLAQSTINGIAAAQGLITDFGVGDCLRLGGAGGGFYYNPAPSNGSCYADANTVRNLDFGEAVKVLSVSKSAKMLQIQTASGLTGWTDIRGWSTPSSCMVRALSVYDFAHGACDSFGSAPARTCYRPIQG